VLEPEVDRGFRLFRRALDTVHSALSVVRCALSVRACWAQPLSYFRFSVLPLWLAAAVFLSFGVNGLPIVSTGRSQGQGRGQSQCAVHESDGVTIGRAAHRRGRVRWAARGGSRGVCAGAIAGADRAVCLWTPYGPHLTTRHPSPSLSPPSTEPDPSCRLLSSISAGVPAAQCPAAPFQCPPRQ
jgi:hypothetical protein